MRKEEEYVKISRWMLVAGVAAIVFAVAFSASFGASKAPAAAAAKFKTTLVLDTGGPNDNGFNKNQVVGLKKETAAIHGSYLELISNSDSDYGPNYIQAVNAGSKLIIAAGFLLGSTVQSSAHAHPGIKYAITDDTAADIGGYANEMGITYATQQVGCLVGVLAAKKAASMGHKVIGVVGGIKIPSVDSYIAGYKYCAQKAVPGTSVLIQYSGSFTDTTACSNVAANEIGQNAEVLFQVAGGCGDAALTYASNHGKWGVGVDSDEAGVAAHILTSALKKTDVGVENAISAAYNKKWKGGKDFVLNLKNKGVGVGKIHAGTPSAWISLMNSYKSKIIAGTLKPPAVLH
jgi:basic membrane protein A